MTAELKKIFPFVEDVAVQSGDGWTLVPADKIFEVCLSLKEKHGFCCLSCLTGADYSEHYEMVYHLFSYDKKETVVLKVKIEKVEGSKPSLSSVVGIWPSANWMERETCELFGINFSGHPNLKNLLLPEDWVGHPMLKSYKEPEQYCGMSTTR